MRLPDGARPLQRRGPARVGSYRPDEILYLPLSSLPRFGSGSCDSRHKLSFEYPIIFWTLREAPLLCPMGDSTPKNSAHGQKIALTAIIDSDE
jgi:hypothetical protein